MIKMYAKLFKLVSLLTCLGAAWFAPIPDGVTAQAWQLLVIFIGVIIAMMAKMLPTGSLAIVAMSACSITNTLSLDDTIASFGSKIVWLVFSAFILARGFTKTGLGARVGYYFVYLFGKNTLGLSYSLIFSELFLSPLIPSNTARGAGIMFPIANSISKEYECKELGGFLMKICFHANIITSAMFMTASAANPLITSISKSFGFDLSWVAWLKTAIIPCGISLLILPWLLIWFFPKAFKQTPEIQLFAKQQIHNNGKLKTDEWIMLATFLVLLIMWSTSSLTKIDPTISALIGLSILLITKVLTWDDVVSEKEAWNTFIWLATLLMLATNLSKLGIIDWMSKQMYQQISGFHWQIGLLLLAAIYFAAHYFLASITSHVSALYAAFCSITILLGAPIPLVLLVFAGISNFSSAVTHYTTGSGPLFFSANYISMPRWWKIGLIIGVINSVIWLTLGSLWWKVLNIW